MKRPGCGSGKRPGFSGFQDIEADDRKLPRQRVRHMPEGGEISWKSEQWSVGASYDERGIIYREGIHYRTKDVLANVPWKVRCYSRLPVHCVPTRSAVG